MTKSAPGPALAAARLRPGLAEVLVALACFAVLCGAALARPVKLLEPDDYAYRASIVALTEGNVRLTEGQYKDLALYLREQDARAGCLVGDRGVDRGQHRLGGLPAAQQIVRVHVVGSELARRVPERRVGRADLHGLGP